MRATPAERLWPLVDEPAANEHFETLAELDPVVGERCRQLYTATEAIKAQTRAVCAKVETSYGRNWVMAE